MFAGTGPGMQSDDGCSVELYRQLPYGNDLDAVREFLPAGSTVLELGCAAGRLTRVLVQWNLLPTAVDSSAAMLAQLPAGIPAICSRIETLQALKRFDVVLLASTLINHPDSRTRASFLCRVELRYRYLDQGRAQADEQRLHSLADGNAVADDRAEEPGAPAGGFELATEDVERIKGWDPLDGVILFTLTDQWDKVPADLWRHWLDQLGLEEPFPPAAYLQAPKLKKRAVLADALGVSRDVIYQRWLRLKLRFQQQMSEQSGVSY